MCFAITIIFLPMTIISSISIKSIRKNNKKDKKNIDNNRIPTITRLWKFLQSLRWFSLSGLNVNELLWWHLYNFQEITGFKITWIHRWNSKKITIYYHEYRSVLSDYVKVSNYWFECWCHKLNNFWCTSSGCKLFCFSISTCVLVWLSSDSALLCLCSGVLS